MDSTLKLYQMVSQLASDNPELREDPIFLEIFSGLEFLTNHTHPTDKEAIDLVMETIKNYSLKSLQKNKN